MFKFYEPFTLDITFGYKLMNETRLLFGSSVFYNEDR